MHHTTFVFTMIILHACISEYTTAPAQICGTANQSRAQATLLFMTLPDKEMTSHFTQGQILEL